MQVVGEAGQKLLDVVIGLALGKQLLPGSQFLPILPQPIQRCESTLEATSLAQQRGAFRRVVPKTRGLQLLIDLGNLGI